MRPMANARAGSLPQASDLVDLAALERAYYTTLPDPHVPAQRVAFGTSGHRGSSLDGSFNEAHLLAIAEAICDYRASQKIDGPLLIGIDTHALSVPALRSTLEVMMARGVDVVLPEGSEYTPTPVISHAILALNRSAGSTGAKQADGVVITPSHNPPDSGGIKYDPPHGGPADVAITTWIETRANELLALGVEKIRRVPFERALKGVNRRDLMTAYVDDLATIVDLRAIADAKLRLGVDAFGGASLDYWRRIGERYRLDITLLNPAVDKTFRFMPLDHDGKIRTDCSSPYVMSALVARARSDTFDLAFANDADADRHGVVSRELGLLSPNQYLSVVIDYLLASRTDWKRSVAIGKTMVTSRMVDLVTRARGRRLAEVPVGFKWFVEGLRDGSYGFGGEESAGASFLRRDGSVWTTDKDGLLLDLIGAEMLARTGRDPGAMYRALEATHGVSHYTRIDAHATAEQKKRLKAMDAAAVSATSIAGERIESRLTTSPEGNAPFGGLKVDTKNGWFAARPSGTEEIYKIYAESFASEAHLKRLLDEAKALVDRAIA
jgi:phosphoglucomutase